MNLKTFEQLTEDGDDIEQLYPVGRLADILHKSERHVQDYLVKGRIAPDMVVVFANGARVIPVFKEDTINRLATLMRIGELSDGGHTDALRDLGVIS